MSQFTVHTTLSAPDGSQAALAGVERTIGFIPNLAATIAGSPVALQGFGAMQSALRGSTLGAAEREVVGLAVSHENTSAYSMAAHSTFAAGAGASGATLAALRAGEAPPDPRQAALHAFALEVMRTRGHVGEETVADLLGAGYTAEAALEVITQIAYTTMANLVANVAGTPVDDAFAPQAWEPVTA
jgi:uncharacterized peroxidase-related enzyme